MKAEREPIDDRQAALRRLADDTNGLRWCGGLVELLFEELGSEDGLEDLLGEIKQLPPQRYPQAVALAIALRYSWRRDQFQWIARRIRAVAQRARRKTDR